MSVGSGAENVDRCEWEADACRHSSHAAKRVRARANIELNPAPFQDCVDFVGDDKDDRQSEEKPAVRIVAGEKADLT